jgi:hypothetical protein
MVMQLAVRGGDQFGVVGGGLNAVERDWPLRVEVDLGQR